MLLLDFLGTRWRKNKWLWKQWFVWGGGERFYVIFVGSLKGSLGAVVKLLPCDHEVTGSSPGNSLLQKCRERLRTIDPKWSDPSPDPAQVGATCTGAAPFFIH